MLKAKLSQAQASQHSLVMEKIKNMQIAKEKKKHDYFHSIETNLLLKKIDTYKHTVDKQAYLIQELTKKLQSSQSSLK